MRDGGRYESLGATSCRKGAPQGLRVKRAFFTLGRYGGVAVPKGYVAIIRGHDERFLTPSAERLETMLWEAKSAVILYVVCDSRSLNFMHYAIV